MESETLIGNFDLLPDLAGRKEGRSVQQKHQRIKVRRSMTRYRAWVKLVVWHLGASVAFPLALGCFLPDFSPCSLNLVDSRLCSEGSAWQAAAQGRRVG